MTFQYFQKMVRIRFTCGHTKIGVDTLREQVEKYQLKCPKCNCKKEV